MISVVYRNLIANFSGVGLSSLVHFVCIPFYVKLMGIESYGLIGFHIMLMGALQIFDLGLSPTINRELARYSVQTDKADEARDFVRTLEISCWCLGIITGAAIMSAASFITTHWISTGSLPLVEVQCAIVAMGVIAALQWPLSLYVGGLMGLQHQVLANAVRVAVSIVSHGGAVAILWLYSPTITCYLTWQLGVAAVQTLLVAYCLWSHMPRSTRRATFSPQLIRGIWRFAAGMSGITFTALIIAEMDKVMLSKLLTLENFGYYTLAGMLSGGLYTVIWPIYCAFFPTFSSLVAEHDEFRLRVLYHRAAQIMAVVVLPVSAVAMLFSEDILDMWTGDRVGAHISAPILSWLVIGTALNGLMNIPHALQIAYGWTRIGLTLNLIFVVIMFPGIFYLVTSFGAVGGAMAWMGFNTVYMMIGVPLTHARLLNGDALRWFTLDVGLPLAGVVVVVGIGRFIISSPLTPFMTIMLLTPLVILAMVVASAITPETRELAIRMLKNFRGASTVD
jgi:O-antigen/teichoic acid export membrane protein